MDIFALLGRAKQLLVSPADCFRQLQESDGIVPSILYALLMAVLTAVLSIFFMNGGVIASFFSGLGFSLYWLGLWLLVGTPAMYFLWGRYGSGRSLTVSFQACAASSVLMPVFFVLHSWFGAIGLLVALLWLAYVLSVASVEVHGLTYQESMPILMAIASLLFLFNQVSPASESPGSESESGAKTALSDENKQAAEAYEAIEEAHAKFKADFAEGATEGSGAVQINESLQAESALQTDGLSLTASVEKPDSQASNERSAAAQLGTTMGELVTKTQSALSNVGEELERAGTELKAGLNRGSAQEQVEEAEAEADTTGKPSSLLTDLAGKTGETVGTVTRELGGMAAGLKEGFDSALSPDIPDDNQGGVGIEESALSDSTEPDSTTGEAAQDSSALNTAGSALGNVVQGLGDIAAEVGEGFQRAITGEPADPLETDSPSPAELGESMAAFVLELDKAIESGVDTANGQASSASKSIQEFLEAYQDALQQSNPEDS